MKNPQTTHNKLNKTPLKWAGSKARVINQLRPHLPKTKCLVEPFAGSCAVMMNTDYESYLIADINDDLINFYQFIKSTSDPTWDNYTQAEPEYWWPKFNNPEKYYEARDRFNHGEMNNIDRAIAFLILNRHCYNGLCRYNQKGEFNVPYGHYKKAYFPREEMIAFYQKINNATVDMLCLPWQKTLSLAAVCDGIYCDPPYMGNRDSFTAYHTNGFTDADQEALAFALKDLNDRQGNPITVSNSTLATELYADLGFTIHEITAPRSISAKGNRQSVTEIVAVLEGVS